MSTQYKESTGLKANKGDMRGLYIILGIVVLVIFMVIGSIVGNAMPSPESYGENQCELIAKDYQKAYGGSLIWLQFIDEQGNPILGEYSAHILNKVYDPIRKEMRYIDYQSKTDTRADYIIHMWDNKPVRMYDLSKERPEWSMIWHY